MRSSMMLPLAIAIGCGTVAAVGVTHAMRNSEGGGAPPTAEILVAVTDLDVGDQVTAESVRLEKWPADRLPLDATNELKAVEGKYINQRLFKDEPILLKKLNDTNNDVRIPVGFRAVTLDLKDDPGLAYLVRPGHRTDVMGFFQKNDVIPETTTKKVLSNVRIFAVDGETVRREEQEGARKAAKTVSLLIREEDQEAWTWAEIMGKLRLNLNNERGSLEAEKAGGSSAGVEFKEWMKEVEDKRAEKLTQEKSVPAPVVIAPESKEDWRMEVWTPEGPQVYQWRDGSPTPELLDPEAKKNAPKPTTDYSYLNGSQSPFFAPPAGAKPPAANVPSGAEEQGTKP